MRQILAPLIACLILAAPPPADAVTQRSQAVTREFQRLHPCPSTLRRYGACPGFVKDHIIPLCAGGPDSIANLQWQTIKAAKAKDVEERRQCRRRE